MSDEPIVSDEPKGEVVKTPVEDSGLFDIKQSKFAHLFKQEAPKSPEEGKKTEEESPPEVGKKEAPVPAKTEGDALDEDFPPEVKSEAAKSNWKILKAEKNKLTDKVAKLEKQLLETKTKAVELEGYASTAKELEEVKKANAELNAIVERLGLENHPKFRAKFDKAISNSLAEVKDVVVPELVDRVSEILSLPEGPQKRTLLNGIYEEMDAGTRADVSAIARDIRKVNLERQSALDDAKGAMGQFRMEEQAALEAKNKLEKARYDSMFEEVMEVARKSLPDFQEKEGEEGLVKENVEAVRSLLFDNREPLELMRAAVWSRVGERSVLREQLLLEKISRQEKKIAELSGAQPKTSAPSGANADPDANKSSKTGSFMERPSFISRYKQALDG